MFCTVEDVAKWTKFQTSNADIAVAQGVIEAFVGKVESEIDRSKDRFILARMTAYQVAFMRGNTDVVFEQVAARSIGLNSSVIDFGGKIPQIAPLAELASRSLSWKGSRSVHTGSVSGFAAAPAWEVS